MGGSQSIQQNPDSSLFGGLASIHEEGSNINMIGSPMRSYLNSDLAKSQIDESQDLL